MKSSMFQRGITVSIQTSAEIKVCVNQGNSPYDIFRLIFLFVASLVSTSLSIEMVDMLSDLNVASPFLKQYHNISHRLLLRNLFFYIRSKFVFIRKAEERYILIVSLRILDHV
jgi:hypothetical protein